MPRFDSTGPAGMGPMTGGGRGWCNLYWPRYAGTGPYPAPYPVPPGATYTYGLGRPRWGRLGRGFWGRGRGRAWGPGRGRGWWW
jgi:hypothetical protein